MPEIFKTGSRPVWRCVSASTGVALTVLTIACGSSSDFTAPQGGGGGGGGAAIVSSVTVSPGSANLLVYVVDSTTLGTAALIATPKDAAGNALSGKTVTWSSSDTTVAKVSTSGVVKAVAAGTATIKATSENQSGQVLVTVTRPAVAQVSVVPLTSSIKIGATETLTVTLLDSQQHLLTGRLIVPHNDTPSIITVSGGNVTGVAAGTGTVSYTSEGVATTATVTVTP
jgi:uncharacterized protein YjdB